MDTLDNWHKTRAGLLAFGLVELFGAYVFASLAIDRGSWWWYLLAVTLLVGGLHNLIKLVKKISIHDEKDNHK